MTVKNVNLSKYIENVWFKIINNIILSHYNVIHQKYCIKGYIRIYREKPTIHKLPKESIYIGNNFGCNSGLKYNPIGGDTCTILRTIDNGIITIGNNVGMSNVTLVARDSIAIEDDVLLGGGVKMYDNDFHSLDYEIRIEKPYDNIKSKPIKICKGAFIGAGTYVLKGVTVGEKSIVGAGSVVTKDVPPFEIWAGNPAKFVRKV